MVIHIGNIQESLTRICNSGVDRGVDFSGSPQGVSLSKFGEKNAKIRSKFGLPILIHFL